MNIVKYFVKTYNCIEDMEKRKMFCENLELHRRHGKMDYFANMVLHNGTIRSGKWSTAYVKFS